MGLENYTTYTEIDPNEHISKTANSLTHVAYRNEDAYMYKDYGINAFTDFAHTLQSKTAVGTQYAVAVVWMLSNQVDDLQGLRTANATVLHLMSRSPINGKVRYTLAEEYNGVAYQSEDIDRTPNTTYYFTIEKNGLTLTCKIYSDSQRTNLLKTLALTLHANHSFRYVFACNTLNDGSPFDDTITTQNLNIAIRYTIVLDSRNTLNGAHTGTITFAGNTRTLPYNEKQEADSYNITGNPPQHYNFDHWETTGSVSVPFPTQQSTSCNVSGNGTLTAVWIAKLYLANLSSADDVGGTNTGTITFAGNVRSLPYNEYKNYGSYTITGNPPSAFYFSNWTTTGSVTVTNPNSQTTTCNVNGNGTLKANWVAIHYEISLSSRYIDNGQNTGSITFNGINRLLPFAEYQHYGSYAITGNPPATYSFAQWEVTGSVTVNNPYSRTTTINVNGNGTLKAVWALIVYNVTLQSHSQYNHAQTGTIEFAGVEYNLPITIGKVPSVYVAKGNPPSGYGFTQWETTNGISVDNPTNNPVNVTVSGDGILKAQWLAPYVPPSVTGGGYRLYSYVKRLNPKRLRRV